MQDTQPVHWKLEDIGKQDESPQDQASYVHRRKQGDSVEWYRFTSKEHLWLQKYSRGN